MQTYLKAFYCVVASWVILLAAPAHADEVLNGSFEEGVSSAGAVDGWTVESRADVGDWETKPSGNSASLDIVTDHPHSGSKCAKVTNTVAGTRASLRQKYDLEQFCDYKLTVWLRSAGPEIPIQVDLRVLQGPQVPLAIKTFTVGPQWQQVTVRGIGPETTAGAISISSVAAGAFFVDDVSLVKAGPDTTKVPPALSQPVGAAYFGTHIHEGPIDMPWPKEVAPGFLRLWDDSVNWTRLEPRKGQFDFTRLDAIVAHTPPDVQIILTLGQTPEWASSRPEIKNYYGKGTACMPRDIQDWRDYVRAVGQRYKGRIKYWEIWNECNWRSFWVGGVTNMVTLTRETHDVLKAIDPTNVIMSPGFANDMGEEFINEWFYEGGGKDVDVLAYHFYPLGWNGLHPSVDGAFNRARNLMELKKSYGFGDLPLFDTEYGQERVIQQVAIVAQMNVLYWFAGVQEQNYYTYDDKVFGLTLPIGDGKFDPTKLNAAGIAYAQTRQWLLGATGVSWSIRPDGVHIAQYERPGGYQCFAVWMAPEVPAAEVAAVWRPKPGVQPPAEQAVKPTSFTIPSDWHITTMRDLAGNRRPVNSAEVEITDAPILLETSVLNPR